MTRTLSRDYGARNGSISIHGSDTASSKEPHRNSERCQRIGEGCSIPYAKGRTSDSMESGDYGVVS